MTPRLNKTLYLSRDVKLLSIMYGAILFFSFIVAIMFRHLDQSIHALAIPVLILAYFNSARFREISERVSFVGFISLALFGIVLVFVQFNHPYDIKMWRITLAFLAFTLLFASGITATDLQSLFYRIALIYVAILCGASILDFPSQLEGGYRLSAPFHHNHVAIMATYLIPFVALNDRVILRKRVLIVGLLAIFCILTKSRKSLIGLAAESIFLVFRPWMDKGKISSRGCFSLIGATILTTPFAGDVYSKFLLAGRSSGDLVTLNDRTIIWRYFLKSISANPWIGRGVEGSMEKMKFALGGNTVNIAHAHNLYLFAASTHGLVFSGLVIFLMIYALLVHGIRMINSVYSPQVRRLSAAYFLVIVNAFIQSVGHAEVLYPDTIWGTIMWSGVVVACWKGTKLSESDTSTSVSRHTPQPSLRVLSGGDQ